jgi:hypothetical protein
MEAARGAKDAVSTDLPDHHDRHAAGPSPAPEGQPLCLLVRAPLAGGLAARVL